jgi:hypothetical protein
MRISRTAPTRLLLCGLLLLGTPQNASGSTEAGSCIEPFQLRNHQPLSATAGQLVDSSSYRHRATVILLLASW